MSQRLIQEAIRMIADKDMSGWSNAHDTVTLDALRGVNAEIESLKSAEEAAKEVFGVVVLQKRELEAEGRELLQTISAQQEIIVKLNKHLDRLLISARTAHATLERDGDEWGLCKDLHAAVTNAI